MLDMDPAAIEHPYFDERHIDGDVKSIGSLVHIYDDMFAIVYEEHETNQQARTVSVEKPKLLLYTRSKCHYCKKVNTYLASVNKTVPCVDIGKHPEAVNELIKIGGKKQVPCLVINGKPLYESNDIIQWFKNNPNKF